MGVCCRPTTGPALAIGRIVDVEIVIVMKGVVPFLILVITILSVGFFFVYWRQNVILILIANLCH